MDERFLTAIREVLANEGGYVNDPQDPGGETNHGISKRSYPELDIASLTPAQAIEIYYRDWWVKYRYGEINDLDLATELMDIAVTNPRAAHMAVQRAVSATSGGWLEVDGHMGDKTIRAINAHPQPKWLLDKFRLLCIQHYLGLQKNRFLASWVRRALN
jgi:lysozyme family protein